MAEMAVETASGEALFKWWVSCSYDCHGSHRALRDRIVAQLEARVRAEAWTPSGEYHDRAMHHNGDAREWARFFLRTFPRCGADEDTMTGWFANAMMAMHDGPCAKKTVGREREAAKQAWDVAVGWVCGVPGAFQDARARYLARTYPAPAPAPRSVTLSDGSVVTYSRERDEMHRENVDQFNGSCRREFWPGLLNRPTDTGADFDALKRFAATVEGR